MKIEHSIEEIILATEEEVRLHRMDINKADRKIEKLQKQIQDTLIRKQEFRNLINEKEKEIAQLKKDLVKINRPEKKLTALRRVSAFF